MIFNVTDITRKGRERAIGLCEVCMDDKGDMMLLTPDGLNVAHTFMRARVEKVTVTGMVVTAFKAKSGSNYAYHELYCKAQGGKG